MRVAESESFPQIGQIVQVLRGRDANKLAIIISTEDQRFVWIADGDKRKYDSPKKKNILHLRIYEHISTEVVDSIQQTGRVTNGKLRHAVNKYQELLEVQVEKGDSPWPRKM